ncbi:MAG TPA: hypothetical protein DDZ80_31695 [Cyanobacteria bacterium UBA8803]|nr:hypothetical protein [Cyanobacteria bacterium UBA8803]
MRVHGDTVGVLSVSSCQRGKLFQNRQLAEQITKHIGLALANLKLREAIKNQSFYDPLTKLYHRRYLEESLEREIQKSERNPQHLGIILFRIHCCHNRHHEPYIEPKDENSSPPHPSSGVPHPYFPDRLSQAASDFLLRKIGLFLKSQLRASDIACRYGSEEFMVLLTETPLAFTQKRAEQLRQAIKQLNLQYRNQPLGSMTISGGVASFSQHGLTGKELIRAAQAALLSAEELGGDRIVTY